LVSTQVRNKGLSSAVKLWRAA